jgi:allophanate hydrolase subunit 2
MIDRPEKGMARWVARPMFGQQDRGVSPGGALDLFSCESGNILLGQDIGEPALEIILPQDIRFTEDVWFVVTGAAWNGLTLSGSPCETLCHAEVYRAFAGDVLRFGEKKYGFRSYLCVRAVGKTCGQGPEGRKRGNYDDVTTFRDKDGFIRVLEGPEYALLNNPEVFFKESFRVGLDSSAMGLRLETRGTALEFAMNKDMVSEAVSDGTVQLTPKGPVVLLRHRQTIGGYPRIFNVISADLDILAQVGPLELIRFRKVSMEEAVAALRSRQCDLLRLKAGFPSETGG